MKSAGNRYQFHCGVEGALKHGHVSDPVVRRKDNHDGISVSRYHFDRGQADARGGVFALRFGDEILLRKIRQFLSKRVKLFRNCHDKSLFEAAERQRAVNCFCNQAFGANNF